MAGTYITDMDAVNAVTHDRILKTMPQNVYHQRALIRMLLDNADVAYHGGESYRAPIRDTALGAATFYDGSIGTTLTPAATDIAGSMQNAWAYWDAHASIDHIEWTRNIGPHASDEAVINLAKVKEDAMMDDIGYLLESQLLTGVGTTVYPTGITKAVDPTNTTYCGVNFTTQTGFTPKSLTLATSAISSLTVADLFDIYEDLEDAGVYPDKVICHPETITKLRGLMWGQTDLTPGSNVTIGHEAFSLIKDATKFVPSRFMSTASSGGVAMIFLNFSHDVKGGDVTGGKDYKVPTGKFWHLSLAGPSPLGFDITDWYGLELRPKVVFRKAAGAIMLTCNGTNRQGRIIYA